MSNKNIIESYFVSLGFSLDQKKLAESVEKLKKTLSGMANAIKNTVQTINATLKSIGGAFLKGSLIALTAGFSALFLSLKSALIFRAIEEGEKATKEGGEEKK